MQTQQRLSERAVARSDQYGPEDPNWKQFILDHKKHLQSLCARKTYTPEQMVSYRYRPQQFVIDNEADLSMVWIFLFINDLRNPTEFNESRTTFYVFNRTHISEMHDLYAASESYIGHELKSE